MSYLLSLAIMAVAVGVRGLLEPSLAHRLPFVTLYAAVAAAVLLGGLGPAVVSTLAGYLGAYLLFMVPEPDSPMTLEKTAGALGLLAYLLTNGIIITLGVGMRAARQRAEASAERALAEQRRLAAKEQELELITSRTPVLLARCSRDRRYLFVNRAAAELLGRPPDRIVGHSIAEVMGEEAWRAIEPYVERVLRGEDVEFESEVPYASAGTRFMHVRYTPDRDARGEVCGWLASVQDVTAAKLAEQALRDADRRKDEFLATLAHELRNPLAPVWNAVQLLRLKGPDTPEIAWARDVIDRQMRQMTRLIDDLMDVSRITRNRLELRRERVELAGVLRNAVETSRPLIDAARHALAVELPDQPVVVDGDPARLAQVFANLLNNAAKYSEGGGRITLSACREGPQVVVRVRDEGLGIPAPMLAQVFEPFAQVNRSLERSQGGLGIGLALVKRLVEMHGGQVSVHSGGERQGSEFVVCLPVVMDAASPAQGARITEVRRAPASCRILVVDDNADAGASLALMLGILGYETRTATDGLSGLRVAEEFRPDVALLDIGMPGLDGNALAARLRAEPWARDLLLIAVTGWGQPEDKQRTQAAGFDHHLVKPVDPTALARLLAVAVGARARQA